MDINTSKKNACVHSQTCTGWNYDVYDGVFSQCGPLNPFFAWNSVVDERQFEESIDLFMDQYDIDVFQNVGTGKATRALNQFFSAKYGLFTCYDAKVKWGLINIDPGLIERWERPDRLKRTWYLAIMSLITSG